MPGTIIFKPIEANIISKDKDVLGKMDPYLSFHLGALKRVKGEVAKSGGQHPIWDDAITVEVSDQTSLTVDLKDKDMLIDDKIATFEVDLREVQSQGRVRKWYPIFRKSEPAGELLMEATFSGGSGQFGTGLSQGQYAGVGGLSQGQGQGQYGSTGLSQGQGQYGSTGLTQGQYGSTGLSQGQYGSTGLTQGQYSSTGLGQGQQYGLSQGQGTHYAGGFTGSSIYGQGQSGNVITTPGTGIGHTSTSYPAQSSGLQSGLQQGTQYGSGLQSGLQQGTQYGSGLQQGTQYGSGLQKGTQYGSGLQSGLQQGTQYSSGLQQGTQYGSGLQSGLQQGTQYGSGLQQGSQYSAVPLGGLQQGQYGGLQSGQYGGLPQQGQGSGSQISSEQFAKEALLRGSDPLNTQQNYYHNMGQGGYGQGPHQNLTQTPSFSGTDPMLYEGDKNRFSNPPQQVPFGKKSVEEYGHLKGKHGTQGMNPSTNPNPGYY